MAAKGGCAWKRAQVFLSNLCTKEPRMYVCLSVEMQQAKQQDLHQGRGRTCCRNFWNDEKEEVNGAREKANNRSAWVRAEGRSQFTGKEKHIHIYVHTIGKHSCVDERHKNTVRE